MNGEIYARVVGAQRVALIPLTFGRLRLVVTQADDFFGYDDGW